jgi:hypothetical protein
MLKKFGSRSDEYILASNRKTCCLNSRTDTKLAHTFME